MAEIFALRAANARKRGKKQDYVKELEGRSIRWGKIAHLPANSDKWEIVSEYIVLMSTPKTTKMELRRQYKLLQEIIPPGANPKVSMWPRRNLKVFNDDLEVASN